MSSATNLKYFVGGIPSKVHQKDLYDFFKRYGVVKRITVFNSDKDKKLFGFCFVKFKKIFGGELDLENTQFIFQGRKLDVDHMVRRSGLKQSVQDKHSRRVFLQNVPPGMEREDLVRLFSPFGPISNCFTVSRHAQYGESSNIGGETELASDYGYVIFDNKEDAEYLLKRRFVEVNHNTRIYIKRYCSNLNRPILGDHNFGQGQKKITKKQETHLKDSGATLSNEGQKAHRGMLASLDHQLRPTSKVYHSVRAELPCDESTNLKFNISLV